MAGYEAVALTGDGRVRVVREDVRAPGPGELRIAVRVAGLCATDREVRDGEMVYFTTGFARYPVVPGHEWVGTVVEVAPDVAGFAPGDRVVGECSIGCGRCATCRSGAYHLCPDREETGIVGRSGGLAGELLFPARAAHHVPPGLPDDAAALVEPAAVAVHAVDAADPGPGDSVLVVGAGPIGVLAMQAVRARGGEVTICDRAAARLALAQRLGADHVLDVTVTGPPRQRFDRVVEASGSAGGLRTAIAAARPGATVVCVSLYGAEIPVPVDEVVTGSLRLQGSLGSPGAWPRTLELIAAGALTPDRIVTARYPLSRAAEAFDQIGRPDQLKVVVDARDEE
ncbi:hypothetical protein DT076_05085 [Desertihabitans brevis]|uniref:Enoyl reductase (ER) domain-containing protein n=1 Tax=Desertihabitans brevis TaxID=2268447 RepID=A0A367Z0I5_9ACTN|nr:alcohol dehydrogenase catalytic domain-containing protein [Desertihabitans brevis]RCK70772.1 hypothetical protein DT076_05085 [Desertihabitans brevis]